MHQIFNIFTCVSYLNIQSKLNLLKISYMKKFTYSILIVLLTIPTVLFSQTTVAPTIGDGSYGSPYQIATLDNLAWLSVTTSEWVAGKYFIQTADIDASATTTWNGGVGFSPIGNDIYPFYGNYDGNYHNISGLYINRPIEFNIGFLGFCMGSIQNLGLLNVDISGGFFVGSLVGYNISTITNCYSTGSISGGASIGGLVGGQVMSTITNCYSTCSVFGTYNNGVGGLVGYSSDNNIITNCYSTGSVFGPSGDFVGGLVGINGLTSTVTNSYYDMGTSGQSDTGKGEPKTTDDMKTQSTFVNWDFVTNWSISPTYNDGYPNLDGVNPPLPIPLSNWAIIMGIALIGTTIFIRFRRLA